MTLEAKKKKTVIEIWNQLKPKLQKLSYLSKNKTLIKEAVEFHLLQASSFLPRTLGDGTRAVGEAHLNNPSPEWQAYLQRTIGANWKDFWEQEKKNKQIITECQELLAELK